MTNLKKQSVGLFAWLVASFLASATFAQGQNLTTPAASPHAAVSQTIGLTEVTIDYHRPGVKERNIWGGLVPYGMAAGAPFNFGNEYPWRAGANDNTTISFSTDVTVEGAKIPAGKYGLHMIPTENGPWTLIFSRDNQAWGSFFYDEANDQARISVTPQPADHQEWLVYGFEDLNPNSATAYLHWEKRKIPFKIEVELTETVLANMRKELTGLAGFNWQAWMQAANFCLQNNTNHAEALAWIDRSIASNKNVNNLGAKARLLMQTGKTTDAQTLMEEAFNMAKASGAENDMNNVGYMYLFSGFTDKAVAAFNINVKNHPDSWNVYDSLGEALQKKGNLAESIKNYKIALEKAPAFQKNRIQGILNNMQNM